MCPVYDQYMFYSTSQHNEFQVSKIGLKESQFEQVFILELFKEMLKCFILGKDNPICYNNIRYPWYLSF